MKNADMPAFPVEETSNSESLSFGLTKREYFAAMAMQGFVTCKDNIIDHKLAAINAVKYADALLEELEK